MKQIIHLLLGVVTLSCLSNQSVCANNGSSLDPFSPLEENPNYVPPDDSDSNDDTDLEEDDYDMDAYDSEYDQEDEVEDEENDTKSIMNKALVHTNSTATKLVRFVQKNRGTLTFACVIFAFRREILQTILTATTRIGRDGKRVLKFHVTPTGIMKILLFLDVMRKLQEQQQQEAGSSSSIPPIMMPGRMGLFGMLMGSLINPSHSAYIPPIEQHYTFERLNDRYIKDNFALTKAMTMDSQGSVLPRMGRSQKNPKQNNIKRSSLQSQSPPMDSNRTTIVMELKGLDTSVSTMAVIRDQITFLLNQHKLRRNETMSESNNITADASSMDDEASSNSKQDREEVDFELEVIIVLESPGGSAADYGLAAQQIARLRNEPGVKVTICVDKVAASGGYMMACMSSPGCLYAAPFAVVGSIGVIGQTLNIHKSLQNWGVQPLVFRGGKDKAPVGLVGEVTEEGLAKVQDMVDKTHRAFKNHVANARPIMKDTIDEIATGDVWLGIDAVEIGLVDKLISSDDYIQERILAGEKVLKLLRFQRPRFVFGGPNRQGIPGILHSSFRSISDTISECALLLKRINEGLEDGHAPIDKIATAHATGINKVRTSFL